MKFDEAEFKDDVARGYRNAEATLLRERAKLQFDDLYDFAVHTFLNEAPTLPEASEPTAEESIVLRLGARGIKAAIETAYGNSYIPPPEEGDIADDPSQSKPFSTTALSPAKVPSAYSEQVDRNVLRRSEAFGNALLHDAFTVLGSDAGMKARQFKDAADAEEQLRICRWLEQRIVDIKTAGNDAENYSSDRHFYHPMKLSPKMMGRYPDNTLAPSCLGVSMLAGAFFERAGAETLHAGVIRSFHDDGPFAALSVLVTLSEKLSEFNGSDVSSRMSDSMVALTNKTRNFVENDEAAHAVLYARLTDGTWFQFDPNYNASTRITGEHNAKGLDDAATVLDELKAVAPHTQVGRLLKSASSPVWILDQLAESLDREDFDTYSSSIESKVNDILKTDESTYQAVLDSVISPYFELIKRRMPDDDGYDYIFEQLRPSDMSGSILEAAFYRLFPKYVLWGDDMPRFARHWQDDGAYRERRLGDLRSLPLLILAEITRAIGTSRPWYTEHGTVELGRTAMRIGLSVLSDVDSYIDHGLPASFWMSTWPGDVPIAGFADRAERGTKENLFIRNNVAHARTSILTSHKNKSKITKFTTEYREETDNGTNQKG